MATKTAADSRKKDSLRTWLGILACETRIEQRLRSLFRENFQVTLPQFDVLSELEHADSPLTMSELSNELMVSNGNITGVIDRLVKMDLVERRRPEHDRRIQHIALTRQGSKEFNRMAQQHEEWVTEMLRGLSRDDMRQMQSLLRKARLSLAAAGRKLA
ncbi:MAG TPA: MarR family transcriptional regulator [Woeseiaceae bacterium]|nr:MarR family transcriptional regulator [Woeseiaceae bacterium]